MAKTKEVRWKVSETILNKINSYQKINGITTQETAANILLAKVTEKIRKPKI